jgi:hypothetical protein
MVRSVRERGRERETDRPLGVSSKLIAKNCYSFDASTGGEVSSQVIGRGFIVNLSDISAQGMRRAERETSTRRREEKNSH